MYLSLSLDRSRLVGSRGGRDKSESWRIQSRSKRAPSNTKGRVWARSDSEPSSGSRSSRVVVDCAAATGWPSLAGTHPVGRPVVWVSSAVGARDSQGVVAPASSKPQHGSHTSQLLWVSWLTNHQWSL